MTAARKSGGSRSRGKGSDGSRSAKSASATSTGESAARKPAGRKSAAQKSKPRESRPPKIRSRPAPLELDSATFRSLGHKMVNRIADFLDSLPERPVTPGESPAEVRRALRSRRRLPRRGADPDELLAEAADLLFEHSLFNGHPRFLGYITSSAAPIGALGDLLAAAVNPNVGAWALAPMATEIELQTVRWIAELVGYPTDGGGLLVSGGNMANLVGFLAGLRARAPWDLRQDGIAGDPRRLAVYAGRTTHTWIDKAADLSGLGLDAVRRVGARADDRMDADELRRRIVADIDEGRVPVLVSATAGSVETGAVDPLREIAEVCREYELWLHVDGAYGAPAAALPEASEELRGLAVADSLALDPHKWLYAPLEVGCVLVRDVEQLRDAFWFRPPYYHFSDAEAEQQPVNFYELGPQNSRGFRALKVWLGLRAVGRDGYVRMIRDDVALARSLHDKALAAPEIEAGSCRLSITTFRYVPDDLDGEDPAERDDHLDRLNERLLDRLQKGGEAFVSNAMVGGRYWLRACIVNFRTTEKDLDALLETVTRIGREVDAEMRQEEGS